jgi:hypothetical protein
MQAKSIVIPERRASTCELVPEKETKGVQAVQLHGQVVKVVKRMSVSASLEPKSFEAALEQLSDVYRNGKEETEEAKELIVHLKTLAPKSVVQMWNKFSKFQEERKATEKSKKLSDQMPTQASLDLENKMKALLIEITETSCNQAVFTLSPPR